MANSARSTADAAGRKAEEGGRTGLVYAARAGYAARGIVYLFIGALAFMAAVQGFGSGETTGARGAIQQIFSLPGGTWLVGAMAVGLLGFTLWRLVQGFADVDYHGADAKGMAVRAGMIGSGVVNGALAVYAASLVWTFVATMSGGGGGGGSGGGSAGATAWLMGRTWGMWLIVAFGVIAWGVAVALVVKAVQRKYRRNLDPRVAGEAWVDGIARFGLCAKALVLALIGSFLVLAGLSGDTSQAQQGLPAALTTLRQQPYGAWLLGLTAAGLVAFGIYGLVQARYRIIRQP